jgi:hypothetical protein
VVAKIYWECWERVGSHRDIIMMMIMYCIIITN